MSWIRQIGDWIAGAAAFLGPWGVFVVSLSDSLLIPLPQGVDAILVAQAIATPDIAYFAAGLGTLGSLIGSIGLYLFGRRAGQAILSKHLSPHGIRRLRDLMGQWGATLLIPATMTPIPLPMKPFVLAAGIFQMPLLSFSIAIGVARVVRYFGVVYLAMQYGDAALAFAAEHIDLFVLGCALVVALFVWAHRVSNRWLNRTG